MIFYPLASLTLTVIEHQPDFQLLCGGPDGILRWAWLQRDSAVMPPPSAILTEMYFYSFDETDAHQAHADWLSLQTFYEYEGHIYIVLHQEETDALGLLLFNDSVLED